MCNQSTEVHIIPLVINSLGVDTHIPGQKQFQEARWVLAAQVRLQNENTIATSELRICGWNKLIGVYTIRLQPPGTQSPRPYASKIHYPMLVFLPCRTSYIHSLVSTNFIVTKLITRPAAWYRYYWWTRRSSTLYGHNVHIMNSQNVILTCTWGAFFPTWPCVPKVLQILTAYSYS